MRIVFMGGKRRGSLCLQDLLRGGEHVVGVFCLREHPHEVIYYETVEQLARQRGIPAWTPDNINSQYYVDLLRELHPDVVLVVGWYQVITRKVLHIPTQAFLILHDSLLPRYRGSATTNWPLINGETETGVTIFWADEGIDTGDVLAQKAVPIEPDDTAKTLLDRKDEACVAVVQEAVRFLHDGTAPRIPQNHDEATYMGRRFPEDGLIDWSQPSQRVYDFIRALTYPYPGAFTFLHHRKVFIWGAETYDNRSPKFCGTTGQIIHRIKGKGVLVVTGDGVILVTRVQFDGGDEGMADVLLHPTGAKLGIHVLSMLQQIEELKAMLHALQRRV